ncbi:15560_t:CDS:2 [Entrophospora sp. SA101]|nr:15560_t:CDS:2 [Entrophospora sp. SA101]
MYPPFTFYDIVKNCDCYPYPNELVNDSDNKYKNVVPLIFETTKLGLILPSIIPTLKEYNDKQNPKPFSIQYDDAGSSNYVKFRPHLNTFEKRTEAVQKLFEQWRQEKKIKRLEGWRNELYPVYGDNGEVAFLIERSASPLFGVVTYGIHLSAYLKIKDDNNNNKIKMWIAKRSSTKQTWPGMLDNTVAGGLPYKMSLQECVIKEAIEEASLERNIAEKAKPVGAISYFISSDDGYVYDLELPEDVVPKPLDGEVDIDGELGGEVMVDTVDVCHDVIDIPKYLT